jgi:hypothetical protein
LVSIRRAAAGEDAQNPDWRVEMVLKRQLLTPLRAE